MEIRCRACAVPQASTLRTGAIRQAQQSKGFADVSSMMWRNSRAGLEVEGLSGIAMATRDRPQRAGFITGCMAQSASRDAVLIWVWLFWNDAELTATQQHRQFGVLRRATEGRDIKISRGLGYEERPEGLRYEDVGARITTVSNIDAPTHQALQTRSPIRSRCPRIPNTFIV